MQKHKQSKELPCQLLTHLFLAASVFHRVIKGPFNSNTKALFCPSLIPNQLTHTSFSSYLVCSHFLSPVKCVKRRRAGGHTQHHVDQIRGQHACHNPRPPLFLSSHFLILSVRPTPKLPSSPFSFPSSLALPANSKPHPLLPSSTITPSSFFCSQT